MNQTLKIGFGAADITPEKDRQTIYHRLGNPQPDAVPIYDRLFARATAFRTADCLAIWASLDICVLSTMLRNRIVAELERQGIQADQVALSSTHTHSAPTGHNFHGVEAMREETINFLVEQTACAMRAAVENTQPAEIAFGKTTADLSVNRRQIGRMADINDINAPTGLVDNEVSVAQIRLQDGDMVGILFNYAAHPLTMCPERAVISGDFPGRAIARLCEKGNATHAQFLQGCAGNVNVKISGTEAADKAGQLLADAVLDAAGSAKPSGNAGLRTASEIARLPWGHIPTPAEARKILRDIQSSDAGSGHAHWELPWAEALVSALENGPVPDHAEVLVQAMKVGDAVFLALPGEVFAEIGLEIKKRAGVEHLFVAAYANNGEIGYVPTAAAFSEGGMETDVAPRYYGLFQLSLECGQLLMDSAMRVVKNVLNH